jgi:hypothetical protein
MTEEYSHHMINRRSSGHHNFKIESNNLFFFRFLQNDIRKFLSNNCNIKVSTKTNYHIYAYVSTKDYCVKRWHKHQDSLTTSSLSTVYYLNLTDGPNQIKFLDKGKEYSYEVEEYDLLFFPDSMLHTPESTVGDGKRISINCEIILNEKTSECIKKLNRYYNSQNNTPDSPN